MENKNQSHIPRNIRTTNRNLGEKKTSKDDSNRIPALIIGGALIGNWIAPGVGGAVVGGIVGGIVGRNRKPKPSEKKGK